jgi:TolA-binding protein
MTCPSELERARALTLGAEPAIEAHLAVCTACRAAWRAEAEAIELARELPVAMPSSARREEVRTAVLAASASGSPPLVRRRWLAPAALGATAAGIVAYVAIPHGSSSSLSSPPSPSSSPGAATRAAVHPHPGARYVSVSSAPDEVLQLAEGAIDIDVQPLRPGERFRVVVGDTELEVRGTTFSVTASAQHLIDVAVRHGRVDLRPRTGGDATLIAGQSWHAVPAALVEPFPSSPTSPPVRLPPRPTIAAEGTSDGGVAQSRRAPAADGGAARSLRASASAADGGAARSPRGSAPGGDGHAARSPRGSAPAVDGDAARSPRGLAAAIDGDAARSPRGSAAARDVDAARSPRALASAREGDEASPERAPGMESRPASLLGAGRGPDIGPVKPLGDTPRAPVERSYDQAWEALRAGDFGRAAGDFARVVLLDPDGPLVEDASFWRAVVLARGQRAAEARLAFHDFLDSFRSSPHAGEASAMLGWLLIDARSYDEAAQRFTAAAGDANPAVRHSARAGLGALARREP